MSFYQFKAERLLWQEAVLTEVTTAMLQSLRAHGKPWRHQELNVDINVGRALEGRRSSVDTMRCSVNVTLTLVVCSKVKQQKASPLRTQK